MEAAHEFILDLAEKISMPEVYLEIRKLMEKPKAKISDFEKVVETDSMLSIRIIRIANSQYFGFNRKAEDLYEAISLIGIIQLHDVLLSSLCMRAFYNIPEEILNLHDFWQHGIKCGIASRSIARFCGLPAGSRFFTLGLLLNVGHAAMYLKAPELAMKTLLISQQQQLPIDRVEREHFGFDYCQLGAALTRQWDLPKVYSQVIGHHLYPEQTQPDYHFQTDIVNLAHQMLESPGHLNCQLNQILIRHRQIVTTPNDIEEIIAQEIVDHSDEVFAMLSLSNCNCFDISNHKDSHEK